MGFPAENVEMTDEDLTENVEMTDENLTENVEMIDEGSLRQHIENKNYELAMMCLYSSTDENLGRLFDVLIDTMEYNSIFELILTHHKFLTKKFIDQFAKHNFIKIFNESL